jgi:hypothetical protein
MSDIVLEECSEYYPTNPIFIGNPGANPIFICHDNVKHVVDETHEIWEHRVTIQFSVFYKG